MRRQTVLALGLAVVVAVGFTAFGLMAADVPAGSNPGEMMEHGKGMMKKAEGAAEAGKAAKTGHGMMDKTMMKQHMAKLDAVNASLEKAKAAIDQGDTATAKKEIEAAQAELSQCKQKMESMGSDPVNRKCPITGHAVDPGTPTREYKGKAVGFCCGACPGAWDKLPDAAKEQKLKEMESQSAGAPDKGEAEKSDGP